MSNQIANLVRLLDVESEEVRYKVKSELEDQLDAVSEYLENTADEHSPEALFILHEMLRNHKYKDSRSKWLDWLQLDSEYIKLEKALAFLAETHVEGNVFKPLPVLLDNLIGDFFKAGRESDIFALNKYLFQDGLFTGSEKDYYHPLNSNLCYVLTEREGLPISLAMVLMLTGYRLGIEVMGVNLPGHFLARVDVAGRPYLIDCYNKGRIMSQQEYATLMRSKRFNFSDLLKNPPTATDLVTRVLINLINAYFRAGSLEQHHLAQDLLADLRNALKEPDEAPAQNGRTQFKRGQLVKHKNYGYRGVVVEYDLDCQADDEWYKANKTQPDKDQPWYHVLVDSSTITTYAAQSSLQPDNQNREIRHPLIPLYFQGFKNGFYHRNSVPWRMS